MRAWTVACALVVGCGQVEQGEVTLVIEPARVLVRRGETTMVQVTAPDAEQAVSITASGLPPGVTADPLELDGATPGTLVLRADATATQGAVGVSLEADVGGSVALRLLVGGPPGSLDESFAMGGKLIPALNNMPLSARGMVMTEQGAVVTGFVVSSPPQAITIRIRENGTLDPTFGTGGFVSTGLGTGVAEGIAVTELADDRLVVAGIAGGSGSLDTDFGLFCYSPNGMLDPTFASSGVATFDPGSGFGEYHGISIASDGSLFVAGALQPADGSATTARALHYSSDGVKDPAYTVTEPNVFAKGSTLQPDGKLVMTGVLNGDFWLARYNPNGTRDPGFGGSGIVTTDFAPDTAVANGVITLAGGKLLVVGTVGTGTGQRVALARYNANGSLDVTFGSGGKLVTAISFKSQTSNGLLQIGAQTLFVGARGTVPAVVRLGEDGSPDATFGTAGVSAIDFGVSGTSNRTGAFGVTLDGDGRILISAELGAANAESLGVARLWP